MTQSIVGWLPIFAQPAFVDVVFQSWKFLQSQREVTIHAYVILENHLHWLASGPQLGKRVGESKSFTARSMINLMSKGLCRGFLLEFERLKLPQKVEQDYQIWQEGSHPQLIEHEAMMWQKIEYIHNNPLRRGYVSDPTHWMYSSARNYAGLSSYIDIDAQW